MTRDVGDLIGIRYEARDADGDLVSATVGVTITDPAGGTDTPAVVPASTGLYDAEFTADAVGTWRWKWTVSGSITDVQYGSVDVADPGLGNYITLVDFRQSIGVPFADRDGRMQIALEAAARSIDSFTGRRPGGFYLASTATTRTYETCSSLSTGRRQRLLVDEIGSTQGLVVETGDGTSWTALSGTSQYPANALADGQPITAIEYDGWWGADYVRVTARWGFPAVPAQIASATLIQATRLYKRKESPDGVAGDGSLGVVRLARVDPDVQQLLAPFVIPGIA